MEEAGAGVEVENANDLAEKIILLLHDPDKLNNLGELGKKAIMTQRGSALRNSEIVKKFIVH